jgi:hypothetical protein
MEGETDEMVWDEASKHRLFFLFSQIWRGDRQRNWRLYWDGDEI